MVLLRHQKNKKIPALATSIGIGRSVAVLSPESSGHATSDIVYAHWTTFEIRLSALFRRLFGFTKNASGLHAIDVAHNASAYYFKVAKTSTQCVTPRPRGCMRPPTRTYYGKYHWRVVAVLFPSPRGCMRSPTFGTNLFRLNKCRSALPEYSGHAISYVSKS